MFKRIILAALLLFNFQFVLAGDSDGDCSAINFGLAALLTQDEVLIRC